MEESISSSRPAGSALIFYGRGNNLVLDCYGSGAAEASSEDSGWTAYLDGDDDLLQMQAPADSMEEPEPRKNNKPHVHGGEFASASTVVSSHASTSRMNKVTKKKASSEEERKRPRLELEEDPLQDTASSPLPPLHCSCRMVLDLDVSREVDGWSRCRSQEELIKRGLGLLN